MSFANVDSNNDNKKNSYGWLAVLLLAAMLMMCNGQKEKHSVAYPTPTRTPRPTAVPWRPEMDRTYEEIVTQATLAAMPAIPSREDYWAEVSAKTAEAEIREYESNVPRGRASTNAGFSCSFCIKGNISQKTGERIYHLPGCEYYDATIIRSEYGERWFSSEAEARAAGWRKAYNCP